MLRIVTAATAESKPILPPEHSANATLGVLALALPRLAALRGEFHDLRDASCADGVASAQQTSPGVHGQRAADGRHTVPHQSHALVPRREAQVFVQHDLRGSRRVVDFSHVHG